MRLQQKGFTLIEISIVLVVLGLLAGMMIKTQQLIDNTKFKNWVREIDAYRSAFASFQERYRYMPGDYPFPNRLNPPASFVPLAGNGDGVITNIAVGGSGTSLGFQSIGGEGARSVSQMIMAGFLAGDATEDDQRRPTAVGGDMIFIGTSTAGGVLKQKMYFRFIPVKFAKRYDIEYDDGNAATGAVWALDPTPPWPTDENTIANIYIDL